MKRYEQVAHTADLAARIYGRTLSELFENAAFAMFDMMGDISAPADEEKTCISAEAPDMESLLAAWLNELLYQAFLKRSLFSEFNVVDLAEGRVRAEVRGRGIGGNKDLLRYEIKAATYHALEIMRTEKGYEVTVVFDV
ncbi:MAG: archease [Candidatus Omnitrophota bacterium]